MRAIGVDVGTKRIGLAASDELGITAGPLRLIERVSLNEAVREVLSEAERLKASIIVVGLPVGLDGSEGSSAKAAIKFADALRAGAPAGVSVETWDERFSTAAVNRVLIEGDVSRKKRKENVDKLAAAYILQGWLDSRKKDEDNE